MSNDDLLGVMAAAKLLGVHRSTLSLAVQHHEIVPDAHTPGGHARFTLQTIEAYRAQVRDGPAASGARPRLTQLLAHHVAAAMSPEDLANLAFKQLGKMIPSFTQAMVLVHKPQLVNPWHVELLAAHGVRWREAQSLGALRTTHEFAYLRVLREGTPIICRDTANERMASGTRAFVEQSKLGAFLLLPLTEGEQQCGVLELGFASARNFAPPEVQFFSNIADLLAVAISFNKRVTQYHAYLETASQLIERGMNRRVSRDTHDTAQPGAGGNAAPPASVEQMLTDMAVAYRDITGAFTVICTAGPPTPGMIEDAQVRALALRCASTGQPGKTEWLMEGRAASGTGVPVPLAGGQAVGIAAGWKMPRVAWGEDLYLLQVLAGACVLGLSHG